MNTAALALLLAASPAWAVHNYPIEAVKVVLRVEPDRIVADVDSDSIYWIEEVIGLHPLPPSHWPADALARTEKYANEHLRLSLDGKRLEGRLLDASYAQRPWEVNEEGRLRLRLVYPPAADGSVLSGEADFFEDYRQERLAEGAPILPNEDFRVLLTAPGRDARSFELHPGASSFSLPVSGARRGVAARLLESFAAGAKAALDDAEGWAALAALALSLAPGVPSRRRLAALAAAAAAGAAPFLPAPAWLEWSAGAAAALAAGRWLGAPSAPWLEAAALAVLARAWAAQAFTRLPAAAPGAAEQAAAALGLLAAGAAALAAGTAFATLERRSLSAHSEARAPELFDRRRRLAATALLLVCGYGLFSRVNG